MNLTKDLAEELIYMYSTVGSINDEKGVEVKAGVSWLEGLDESDKLPLAMLYENVAQHLLESDGYFAGEVIAFQLIRFMFKKTKIIYDTVDFLTKMSDYIKVNQEIWDKISDGTNSDKEMDENILSLIDAMIETAKVDEELTKKYNEFIKET